VGFLDQFCVAFSRPLNATDISQIPDSVDIIDIVAGEHE
jgi:hypothetical protein